MREFMEENCVVHSADRPRPNCSRRAVTNPPRCLLGGARTTRRRCRVLLLAILACIAECGAAAAQSHSTGADLSGMVTDESGAVLNGAAVAATNLATGLARQVTTIDGGRYTLLGVPPGTYRIDAHLAGFESATIPEIVLPLGSSLVADITLKVPGVQ